MSGAEGVWGRTSRIGREMTWSDERGNDYAKVPTPADVLEFVATETDFDPERLDPATRDFCLEVVVETALKQHSLDIHRDPVTAHTAKLAEEFRDSPGIIGENFND